MDKKTVDFFHRLSYVNFKNKYQVDDSSVLMKADFYKCLEELKTEYAQIEHTTTKRKFKKMCFALTEKGHYLRLTWRDSKGEFHQRYTNFKDDNKNKRSKVKVFKEFKSMFKENNGVSLDEAFGTWAQSMKRCVPGLFHYDNPIYVPGMCATTGKLDFSSHFPACACGTMPDAHTAKFVSGWAEPTEEYPFAFYIKSGFVAEYGMYNSRDWYGTRYRTVLFESEDRKYPVKPVDDETTILMKASPYKMDKEMMHYYDAKLHCVKGTEEYDMAKTVLLKIVGMFEMNDLGEYIKRPYAHLAAVIKARAIHKMLGLIAKIGPDRVISVIVDGLIYNNSHGDKLGDTHEFIGSLKEEAHRALGRFKGHNQYVLLENGVYDICHAGYDINTDQPDMSKWRKSPAIHIKEMITESLNIKIEDLNNGKEKDIGYAVF